MILRVVAGNPVEAGCDVSNGPKDGPFTLAAVLLALRL